MTSIALTPQQRQILIRQMKRETQPSRRLRMHIVFLVADGYSPSQIARVLYCSRTTIYAISDRFMGEGEAAFADQKPRGPAPALNSAAQQRLETLMEQEQPLPHGFLRSRWTCPLLALQLLAERGLSVSRETIRRTLHRLGFRWRRPLLVPPPKNPEEKRQRLRQIFRVLRQLAQAEGLFFQDETKLDLNPRVGFAWMRRGRQQLLLKPGTNRKLWISGALNWLTGRLHWTAATPASELVQEYVQASQGRLYLHPLLAWSPEDNHMEPIW